MVEAISRGVSNAEDIALEVYTLFSSKKTFETFLRCSRDIQLLGLNCSISFLNSIFANYFFTKTYLNIKIYIFISVAGLKKSNHQVVDMTLGYFVETVSDTVYYLSWR
jgi:hypothetical protein